MTRERWAKRNFKPTKLPHHHYWEKTEMTDKELWFTTFNAVASSVGCQAFDTATNWADKALKHWRENYELRS